MRTKNGEKFKLESVEELLGIQNEESAMDIEIIRSALSVNILSK